MLQLLDIGVTFLTKRYQKTKYNRFDSSQVVLVDERLLEAVSEVSVCKTQGITALDLEYIADVYTYHVLCRGIISTS